VSFVKVIVNKLYVGTSGCRLRVGALTAVAWRFSESAIGNVFTTCFSSKQIKTQIFSPHNICVQYDSHNELTFFSSKAGSS
jgi:hypothetical protein